MLGVNEVVQMLVGCTGRQYRNRHRHCDAVMLKLLWSLKIDNIVFILIHPSYNSIFIKKGWLQHVHLPPWSCDLLLHHIHHESTQLPTTFADPLHAIGWMAPGFWAVIAKASGKWSSPIYLPLSCLTYVCPSSTKEAPPRDSRPTCAGLFNTTSLTLMQIFTGVERRSR